VKPKSSVRRSRAGSNKGAVRTPLPILGPPSDKKIARQIEKLLGSARRIAIVAHERPDGDALGSTVALWHFLKAQGYEAQVWVADPLPHRYEYLNAPGCFLRVGPGDRPTCDTFIALDTTDMNRLGVSIPECCLSTRVVNIDHHLSNLNFGALNWVDIKAAAAGEMVWRLASACGWPAPHAALEALYTALVTDTGQFAYSNTTSRVLHMAAELVERGIDTETFWRRIYLNKTQRELNLEARARGSLEVWSEGRISAIALTQSDFAATGTGPEDAQDFASIPRSLSGAELALFFYAVDGGKATKVSIRSVRGLDACKLAQKFGGGGHRQAAGCTLALALPKSKDLFRRAAEEAVRKELGAKKEPRRAAATR